MAVEVRSQWHKLTAAPSLDPVFVNEAAVAFVRPATGGESFEIGLVSGALLFVRENPAEFLGDTPTRKTKGQRRWETRRLFRKVA
jgi:hypothetical protein